MHTIYFDNAATTSLDDEVFNAMLPYMREKYGNPSSMHAFGRHSRLAIENARGTVASILGAHPSEIFFTSGGTESINTAITAAVRDLGCRRIISSPLEHHATLHTIERLHKTGAASISLVKVAPDGHIDLDVLRSQLASSNARALVTLMHANNEIGNITDVAAIGELCSKHGAIFHCDAVQTIGHYPTSLSAIGAHFISGSGHKFHGPKGTGLLYINKKIKISPLIHGGPQERNIRAGTENVHGIVGFAKALELAASHYALDSQYVLNIKQYMARQLQDNFPEVKFNGDPFGNSLYTVLNASFPKTANSEMLLLNLDMNNICVSGGSACTSGTGVMSHVIAAVNPDPNRVPIRFSFSKHNKAEEVDRVIEVLKEIL